MGADEKESADKSAGWSGAELEGSATEAEATTAEGSGWNSETRTATARGAQESGVVGLAGEAEASGGNTGKAASAVANEMGVGGLHEERPGLRERISG